MVELLLPLDTEREKLFTVCVRLEICPAWFATVEDRPLAVTCRDAISPSALAILVSSPWAVACRAVMFPSASLICPAMPSWVMASWVICPSVPSIRTYSGSVMVSSHWFTAAAFMLERSRLWRVYRSCSTNMYI